MDLVHSHSVKNVNEGLGMFDGSPDQYFHTNDRRNHVAWDSLCFDYGKDNVMHFLSPTAGTGSKNTNLTVSGLMG